jgi:hypothetical protein
VLGALAKEPYHEHEKESTANGGETTAESLQPPVPVAQEKMRQEIIVTGRAHGRIAADRSTARPARKRGVRFGRFCAAEFAPIAQFGSQHRDFFWRFDADANLVPPDLQHGNRDAGTDVDFFPWFPGQYEHSCDPP